VQSFRDSAGSSDETRAKPPELPHRSFAIAKTPMISSLKFDVVPASMEKVTIAPFIQSTPTGLILSKDLRFEEWSAIGKNFGEGMQRAVWSIGDWLVYGEDKFCRQLPLKGMDSPRSKVSAEAYELAVISTGMNIQTLRDIASVCRRIPQSQRVDGLSFDHHRAIATAPVDKQAEWFQIVAPLSKTPSAKRIRLSIRLAGESPRIISDDEVTNRGEHAGHENYIPYLTKLQTIAMKQLPEMNEYQKETFFEDLDLFVELADRYR
jgi:hypothetical protein